MRRADYSDTIAAFLDKAPTDILGHLVQSSHFAVEATQRDAWLEQVNILKRVLCPYRDRGKV